VDRVEDPNGIATGEQNGFDPLCLVYEFSLPRDSLSRPTFIGNVYGNTRLVERG
jgi:hypothetical protein